MSLAATVVKLNYSARAPLARSFCLHRAVPQTLFAPETRPPRQISRL